MLSFIPEPSRDDQLMDVVSTYIWLFLFVIYNIFLVIKPRLERAAAHAQLLKLFPPEYFYFFSFRHQCSWNHEAADKLVLPSGKQVLPVGKQSLQYGQLLIPHLLQCNSCLGFFLNKISLIVQLN